MEAFLMDVFENFGLITCGWSAQWDTGLLEILRKSNKFRFSNYFTYRGEITDELKGISKVRSGTTLKINDADSFFTELKENIISLDRGLLQNPLNAKIASERIKRYLSTEAHKIQFNDFLFQVTKAAYDDINAVALKNPNDPKDIIEAIDLIFAKLDTLIHLLSISVYWAKGYHIQPIVNVMKKFMRPKSRHSSYAIDGWLIQLPMLILYYSIGISSALRGNFSLLGQIVKLSINDRYEKKSFLNLAYSEFILRPDYLNQIYNNRKYTPASELLYSQLQKYFNSLAVDQYEFELAFDFFEYVNNMIFLDQNPNGYGVPGRFSFRYGREWKGPLPELIINKINENSNLIKSGLFRDFEHLKEANEKALKYINDLRFN